MVVFDQKFRCHGTYATIIVQKHVPKLGFALKNHCVVIFDRNPLTIFPGKLLLNAILILILTPLTIFDIL